jgi:hypothetical protein
MYLPGLGLQRRSHRARAPHGSDTAPFSFASLFAARLSLEKHRSSSSSLLIQSCPLEATPTRRQRFCVLDHSQLESVAD